MNSELADFLASRTIYVGSAIGLLGSINAEIYIGAGGVAVAAITALVNRKYKRDLIKIERHKINIERHKAGLPPIGEIE